MTFAPSQALLDWIDHAPLGHALDLGAGEGETARWLVERGFTVEAIERNELAFGRLVQRSRGLAVRPYNLDLADFHPSPNSYSLVVASAVLHFLRPTDLWPLADRLLASLLHGGLLIAEAFTTDDPGRKALSEAGAPQVEPNTYLAPEPIGLIHYFAAGELRRVFAGLEILEYEESRRLDPESDEGYRAGALLVGRKAT